MLAQPTEQVDVLNGLYYKVTMKLQLLLGDCNGH